MTDYEKLVHAIADTWMDYDYDLQDFEARDRAEEILLRSLSKDSLVILRGARYVEAP